MAELVVALERAFYEGEPAEVARQLLGMLLVRQQGQARLVGRIVETEAYLAEGDTANHASRGRTPRNRSMFGRAGNAYVYVIHRSYCLNVVTEPPGVPSAVLLRAVEPREGLELMRARRGNVPDWRLVSGPGRLCQAFGIDWRFDGWDLTLAERLWIAPGHCPPGHKIVRTKRVGVTSAKELELRFYVACSPWISRRRVH